MLVAPLGTATARMRLFEVSATKMVLLGAWKATPVGCMKRAEAPSALSAKPPVVGEGAAAADDSCPASVPTAPFGATVRTAWLKESATYRVPPPSTVRP